MQISPISAVISIKKSFVQEKFEKIQLPTSPDSSEGSDVLRDKIIQLENYETDLNNRNESMKLLFGKGSKIKLIIFAEFSTKGYPLPTPPSRKIIIFSNIFFKFFLLA